MPRIEIIVRDSARGSREEEGTKTAAAAAASCLRESETMLPDLCAK